MDVAAHGVDVSVDGEKCGVMGAAGDLFDEGGEGEGFGDGEGFIVVFLAYSRLAVLVDPHEEKLVYVHAVRFNIKLNFSSIVRQDFIKRMEIVTIEPIVTSFAYDLSMAFLFLSKNERSICEQCSYLLDSHKYILLIPILLPSPVLHLLVIEHLLLLVL